MLYNSITFRRYAIKFWNETDGQNQSILLQLDYSNVHTPTKQNMYTQLTDSVDYTIAAKKDDICLNGSTV